MVAYWVPARARAAGKPLSFSYLLSAYTQSPRWPPGGRVVATRSGKPAMGDNKGHFAPGARRMLVDFAGGDLDALESAQPVKADVSAENGQIEAVTVQRLASGLWRGAFLVTPQIRKPGRLRRYPPLYGAGATETWVYQWTP